MKRLFTILGCLYVIFALTTAHVAMAPTQASLTRDAGPWVHADKTELVVLNNQRLPGLADEANGRERYKVVVWTIPGCSPCKRFKTEEVPALVSAGVEVEIINASVIKPDDSKIRSFPTIIVYHDGKEIAREQITTAKKLLALMPLDKPEPEPPVPPDYNIWDNIKRWFGD